MVESRIGGDHRAVGAAGAHQHRHRHRGLVSRQGGGQAPAVGGSVAVVLVVLDVDDCYRATYSGRLRSEEHTSELQSRFDLVCRLLLEKKNITRIEYRMAS